MDESEIHKAIENFDIAIKTILYDIAKKAETKKDIFLRNSISKSCSILTSIQLLYRSSKYHDGWILYRTLVERLATIYYLNETDTYETFEQWSFIRNYEDQNTSRSDPRFKKILNDPAFRITKSMTKKYNEYKKLKAEWKRPKAEDMLNKEKLDFVYKYGFDYASKHVHPMSDDGLLEFHVLTKLEPNPYKDHDFSVLLNNSLIISTMILQTALNSMSLDFIAVVYNYIDAIRNVLKEDYMSYKQEFLKIGKLAEQRIPMCQTKPI